MTSPISIALLLAATSTTWQDARPWATVTSQEGQFIVEMPKNPNFTRSRTRNGPGGRVRLIISGCETEAGAYIVYKIEFPTAIVKGAEEGQLDEERDEFAKEFNGKVVAEKKVRLDTGAPGRDFTIRGKPQGARGLATIRVREFLAGKAIYALIVVSAPNRELPDDAGRFLGSLTIGTKVDTSRSNRSLAETKPTGKPLEGWGEAVDPDGDCRFAPSGPNLTIEVPGTLHDLNADIAKWNAPRVLREVEGDFIATVKVAGPFQPGGKSLNPKSIPYNGGGLFIWRDSDNYVRLERAAGLRAGRVNSFIAYEEREGGRRGAVHNAGHPPGDIYLRLERRGNRLIGATSVDGRKWAALKPIDINWPARVQVGLAVVNSNSEPLSVRFEEFSLKKGPGGPIDAPKTKDARPSTRPSRSAQLRLDGNDDPVGRRIVG